MYTKNIKMYTISKNPFKMGEIILYFEHDTYGKGRKTESLGVEVDYIAESITNSVPASI